MNILFDHEQLLQLITSLYTLTGLRANIMDVNGKDICLSSDHAPFCEKINATQEGHARCEGCDARMALDGSHQKGFYFYRCHAGVCEAVMPVTVGGTPLAYLMFGQFLDNTSMEQQWENTLATLDWYPGDKEKLRKAFFQFRQYSDEEVKANAEILEALASYIQLKGMILTTEQTELQKLELYLDEHYMEKLSLESISAQLHIGRTKLCSLAKELSGGETLSAMIAQRRVEAAKVSLLQSDLPISEIAEQVGISDYNYFSKIFRSHTGMTPSAFRKKGRQNAGIYG